MKKLLQLILISTALLLTFSCNGGGAKEDVDPSDSLTQTWMIKTMAAYDSPDCTGSELFRYSASSGSIVAQTAEDCNNLELFFELTEDHAPDGTDGAAAFDGDATPDENGAIHTDFCTSIDLIDSEKPELGNTNPEKLEVLMYMQLSGVDSLTNEAAGRYIKTMYAHKANGQAHDVEYSTYGRYFTYGDKMNTQILAKIENDTGQDDRVALADDGPEDLIEWKYEATDASLTMVWVGNNGGGEDQIPSCIEYSFSDAEDYALKGCMDENAKNYFGGENNEFEITATEESGKCIYSVDEASKACVKIDHPDTNGNGIYAEDEIVTLEGFIDCSGECQFAGEISWVGDGVCDGPSGNIDLADGPSENTDLPVRESSLNYNCEAFNWDGWDCACAPSCLGAYIDADPYDGIGGTALAIDDIEDSQLGEGNQNGLEVVSGYGSPYFLTGNCQEVCKVEDCGYDIGVIGSDPDDLTVYATWDCCAQDCLTSLIESDGTTCSLDAACNTGECNWYRKPGTTIGACCDQSGPDGIYGDDLTTLGVDESTDDIDCASLAGNGSCDQECNSGACNNDGGDCE